MNREQNIDDILKLLKESVNDEEFKSNIPPSEEQEPVSVFSDEDIKQRLKETYTQEQKNIEDEQPQQNPYDLDYTFFERVQPKEADKESEFGYEKNESECLKEPVNRSFDESTLPNDVQTFNEPFKPENTPVFSHESNCVTSVLLQEKIDKKMDSTSCPTEEDEPSFSPKITIETQPSHITETFIDEPPPPDILSEQTGAEPWIDYETESEQSDEVLNPNSVMTELHESEPSTEESREPLHASVIDLMIQLGCEDEWKTAETVHASEEFVQHSDDCSHLTPEKFFHCNQTETMYRTYQSKKRRSLFRLLGVAILTGILFFYDTLPLFGIRFSGIINYSVYPGAYVLVGFQLLLICSLFLYKELWNGIKKVFSFRTDPYSAAVLIFLCVFFYDILMVWDSVWPCSMFHFLSAWMFLMLVCGEHLLLLRELKVFSVYSTEKGTYRYTLQKSEGKSSFAEQMYESGFNRNSSVYQPKSIDCSNGVFSFATENMLQSRMLSFLILPAFLISMVLMLSAVLLQHDMESSAKIAMTVLFTAIPLYTVCSFSVPLYISAKQLQSRGIGIAGNDNIEAYANGNAVIYNDLHLFRTCSSKEIGLVIYEKEQSQKILGALALLYESIGGPMKDAFSEIPPDFRFCKIKIHRIFRNGIEAFIDRKHLLIVGDVNFMQRYGFAFSEDETDCGEQKTLCVSLDGKTSAKLSVQYQTTPLFEVLVERLAKEDVQMVIETFDPLIQADSIASARRLGTAPISVLHKNVSHFYHKNIPEANDPDTGMLATDSRLKLIEALIWCKRLSLIRKQNHWLIGVWSALGVFSAIALLCLDGIDTVNQYWLWLFAVLSQVGTILPALYKLPRKKDFTVEAYRTEINRLDHHAKQKQRKKQEK